MEEIHKITFYLDKVGEWRWQVKAQNGEIIGASTEGYMNRGDCLHNLESIHGKLDQ